MRTVPDVGAGTVEYRKWVPWAVALVLTLGVSGTILAQATPHSDIRISLTADQPELTVGDLVTLVLEVTHPADLAVTLPRLGAEWGVFEVLSQTPAQTIVNGDGTKTTGQYISVMIFAPGTFETPDLPMSVRAPDGTVEQVSPAPVRLTVRSVLSGPDEQLKDLRPPADLSIPLWKQSFARVMAAIATLATLGSAAYVLHRRSRSMASLTVPVADARAPWEVAVQELDRIGRLDLPGEGKFKEHYGLVAGVTRTYIHATYLAKVIRQDATDMTTDEMEAAVARSLLDGKNARLTVELLLESDLVRYSAYTPSASEAYEALAQARRIVGSARPPAEVSSCDGPHDHQEMAT